MSLTRSALTDLIFAWLPVRPTIRPLPMSAASAFVFFAGAAICISSRMPVVTAAAISRAAAPTLPVDDDMPVMSPWAAAFPAPVVRAPTEPCRPAAARAGRVSFRLVRGEPAGALPEHDECGALLAAHGELAPRRRAAGG